MNSPFIVQQIIGDGLRDIILSLMMQNLVIDLSLRPLQLLVSNFVGVDLIMVIIRA